MDSYPPYGQLLDEVLLSLTMSIIAAYFFYYATIIMPQNQKRQEQIAYAKLHLEAFIKNKLEFEKVSGASIRSRDGKINLYDHNTVYSKTEYTILRTASPNKTRCSQKTFEEYIKLYAPDAEFSIRAIRRAFPNDIDDFGKELDRAERVCNEIINKSPEPSPYLIFMKALDDLVVAFENKYGKIQTS
ncbi:hypothetical protein [Pseudodesulfovibrio indicus]|uniref:hypothetical protein n=1 Tax=Pseudodesulfovibrio indicus TaxID=1716143 RepID=UPI00106462AB|nr:hypothetical protein [Pseudodesulfovibrio indicus]